MPRPWPPPLSDRAFPPDPPVRDARVDRPGYRLNRVIGGDLLAASAWCVLADLVLLPLRAAAGSSRWGTALTGAGFVLFTSGVLFGVLRALAQAQRRVGELSAAIAREMVIPP